MANLSFLTTLDLHECELFGDFPVSIFHLKNLRSIYVRDNKDLTGHLPEFNGSSRLVTLDLHGTNFSGKFPSSIGKIDSLKQLDVGACYFTDELVPSSLGNLGQLVYLDLSWLFRGSIPDSFANLTKLTTFRMNACRLTGQIPSWLGRFNQLIYLDLAINTLNSSLPTSFLNLTSLEILFLQTNSLSGRLEFQMFQKLHNLKQLDLSSNNLDLVSKSTDMNATNFPQLTILNLMDCGLNEFPYFLKNQMNLVKLGLYLNNLQSQVPNWMYNVSTETMMHLSLSANQLSGQLPVVLPWRNLQFFSVGINNFHGSLPALLTPTSTIAYFVNENNFSGNISPWFCNMTSLQILNLSNNSLSGTTPHCFQNLSSLQALVLSDNNFGGMFPQFLGNFSDNLVFLLLGNNSFHGNLPQNFSNKCSLKFIDVSYNQLEGSVPRSLGNCVQLESLVMSNNKLSDVFPLWLRTLPELKVLAMRRNYFRGAIGKPQDNQRFSKLRVFDISHNNFSSEFHVEYILSENAMGSSVSIDDSTYMEAWIFYSTTVAPDGFFGFNYGSYFTITSKGVDRYYSKVHKTMAFIDISSNQFQGEIDAWIGNLTELLFLNVSNNLLTGSIPSSFGKLINLESLDLSSNKLSGKIPQQLAQLTFLGELNVSNNNLNGPIPTGTQLQGFDASAYEGNSELCGSPLPRKCEESNIPAEVPPFDVEDHNTSFWLEFDWKFVMAGPRIGGGFVAGVVLADMSIRERPEIFLDMVERSIGLMYKITRCKRFRHRSI